MSGANAVAVEAMLREYLEISNQFGEHQAEAKRRTALMKEISDRMLELRPIIEKLVEPVCGSATKPTIYTYTNGQYQTISVFWDGRGGRIALTENAR